MSQTNLFAAVGRLLLAILFILSGLGKLGRRKPRKDILLGRTTPADALLSACHRRRSRWRLLLLVGYQTRIASLALAAFTLRRLCSSTTTLPTRTR
jgi:putative oxidoreductase